MKSITRLAGLLLAVAMIAAPALAQSEGADDEKVVYRLGMINDIDSLNPFKALEIPSFEASNLTYNLLVEFAQEDMSPVPGLAESWETSDDGLTGRTTCATTSPGTTANRSRRPTSSSRSICCSRTPARRACTATTCRRWSRSRRRTSYTVVMTTKKPSVQMEQLYVPILPEHIWGEVPPEDLKAFPNEPSIGTGPFQAVEWDRGQFVKFVKNPDYFGGEAAIDEIYFQLYDNDDTMVQALKRGEVDYIFNPSTELFLSLENEPVIETLSSVDPGYTELAMNVYEPTPGVSIDLGAPAESKGHPALLDVHVRQAINWAIDEQELTDRILRGQGTVGSTLVPPTMPQYHLELDESGDHGLRHRTGQGVAIAGRVGGHRRQRHRRQGRGGPRAQARTDAQRTHPVCGLRSSSRDGSRTPASRYRRRR